MKFLKNRSEITSGKTERVSYTVKGFDSEGNIMNHQNQLNFSPTCMVEKLVDLSTKLIIFIDMGGTKSAHNQMIQIINSQFPDYALQTISSLLGWFQQKERAIHKQLGNFQLNMVI